MKFLVLILSFLPVYAQIGVQSTQSKILDRQARQIDSAKPIGANAAPLVVDLPYLPTPTKANLAHSSKATLTVCPSGCGYTNVGDAINNSNLGDTISVGVGTYSVGQIQIMHDLRIQGASRETTIFEANSNTGSGGDGRAWFLIHPEVVLDIEDLTLDGGLFSIWQALRFRGSGNVCRVNFNSIQYNQSGPNYQGTGVAAFGTGPVNVSDCWFENIGRVGTLYYSDTVNGSIFSNNDYLGKGVGSWLDYAVEVGGGADVILDNNRIRDNLGLVMYVDDLGITRRWISSGILVTHSTLFAEENTLWNSYNGLTVGTDSADTSQVLARLNCFSGHGSDAIESYGPVSEAPLNWYGHPSGPTHDSNPGGSGDRVSDGVYFLPFLTDCGPRCLNSTVSLPITTDGKSGTVELCFMNTTGFDTVHVTSTDGLDQNFPTNGAAQFCTTINTLVDGSPALDIHPSYSVTYLNGGIPEPTCPLPTYWALVFCHLQMPADAVFGSSTNITARLTNALWDSSLPGGGGWGTLTYPNGFVQVLRNPVLQPDNSLLFNVHINNLKSLHNGLYTLSAKGGGPGNVNSTSGFLYVCGGTNSMPAIDCRYVSRVGAPVHQMIAEGMELLVNQTHHQFLRISGRPDYWGVRGGNLGGEEEVFDSTLTMQITGTGVLEGYKRTIDMAVMCTTHTGARDPNDPVQWFPTDMNRVQGEVLDDPDFEVLTLVGGSDFLFPSPGLSFLTRVPGGEYSIESFFDVGYEFEFQARAGSELADLLGGAIGGTTQGQVRMGVGDAIALDQACRQPDDGTGTIDFPSDCPFLAETENEKPKEVYRITEGLGPDTEILLNPIHEKITCISGGPTRCGISGGSLGGEMETFSSELTLRLNGTGLLEDFERLLSLTLTSTTHTAPRVAGEAIQTFATDMFRMEGELTGDEDFTRLEITAGTDLGMPGPGQATLTRLTNGDFAVDSFFDITYQIDYEGAPGGRLAGMSGTNTGTMRIQMGDRKPLLHFTDLWPDQIDVFGLLDYILPDTP